MYLKVRKLTAKPGDSDLIINISKTALIQDLRKFIFKETDIEVDKQRLFYKGKQLIDDHRIVDYDIHLNDVIQLMIRAECPEIEPPKETNKTKNDSKRSSSSSLSDQDCSHEDSQYYQDDSDKENLKNSDVLDQPSTSEETSVSKFFAVEDAIDYLDPELGCWFEGRVANILKAKNKSDDPQNKEPNIIFRIMSDVNKEQPPVDLVLNKIRPRSHYTYQPSELVAGQTVLINFNIEDPSTRGYWYDFIIATVTRKTIKGTLLVGADQTPIDDCTVRVKDEALKIEKTVLLTSRKASSTEVPELRKNAYYCEKCKDVSTKTCKECGCKICAGKQDINTIILCDECDYGYHIKCLNPPLAAVPEEDEWYCPSCKNDENEIVKAGDKLKYSKKKAKMASNKEGGSSRDWGVGMACVGRTKECTIVSKDHYGPVPGVEVGTCWMFRMQVSEAGIHRPHVAGIHGRESDGAYSLVLSGGYVDDVDNGDEFIYSGSGGRDLSGNKRVNEQSSDQVLTRMNMALALNCNVPLNKNGAVAKNWQGGKPVRVVRNFKLSKHSKYAPKIGNRYDGLYKVVKYYPEKGLSGFLVWKYLLRRDDPSLAPWLSDVEPEVIYPEGYLEAKQAKEEAKAKEKQKTSSPRGQKRNASTTPDVAQAKKKKIAPFKLPDNIAKTVTKDEANCKLWNECKEVLVNGKKAFLEKVEEVFTCVCCQEVVYTPVTLDCKHNVCKACLKRSFQSEIHNCPWCRFELGQDFKMNVNTHLSQALLSLFPGYGASR